MRIWRKQHSTSALSAALIPQPILRNDFLDRVTDPPQWMRRRIELLYARAEPEPARVGKKIEEYPAGFRHREARCRLRRQLHSAGDLNRPLRSQANWFLTFTSDVTATATKVYACGTIGCDNQRGDPIVTPRSMSTPQGSVGLEGGGKENFVRGPSSIVFLRPRYKGIGSGGLSDCVFDALVACPQDLVTNHAAVMATTKVTSTTIFMPKTRCPDPPLEISRRHPQPQRPVMLRIVIPHIEPVWDGLAVQDSGELDVLVQAHVPVG